jgi:hypothetical protein
MPWQLPDSPGYDEPFGSPLMAVSCEVLSFSLEQVMVLAGGGLAIWQNSVRHVLLQTCSEARPTKQSPAGTKCTHRAFASFDLLD